MQKVLLYIIISLSVGLTSLNAQLCDGNLGDNIFEDGNFGSGTENIPLVDPGIAPGYSYITSPPPNDGSYTITNDITPWQFEWGWADIQDNSDDPEGYMMVVNASFQPGKFYEKVIEGLCENTLYEFSADIHNLHTGANIIKPNVSFSLNDIVEFTTGDIPENGKWNSYGFTFETGTGETTVKLSLANNAPGGIGNDLAIDNISFRACGPEALILPLTVENICEDGNPITLDATVNGDQFGNPSFQWQESLDGGDTWLDLPGETNPTYLFDQLAAGTYYYRYKIASDLNNLTNTFCQTSFQENLCEGLSLQVGQSNYTESGTFIDTLTNSLGCDSIVTLDLSVFPDQGITADFQDTEPECSYSADGSLAVSNVSNFYPPYSISINGLEAQNLITNLTAGTYPIVITDSYGCTLDTNVVVNAPEEFTVDLGEDVLLELGDELNLSLLHNFNLANTVYISDYDINCSGVCTEINLLPFSDGQIIVQSLSESNCVARDTISIRIDKNIKVYTPNTFTPNGDRINDIFNIFPQEKSFKSLISFSIFDRWGNRMYSTSSDENNGVIVGWDGTKNGKTVSQGVYSYYAEIEFIDASVQVVKGSFTLIR